MIDDIGVASSSCEDPDLEALVDRYAHRARYFAHRVATRFGLDPQWQDDLVSAGYWGLLKAIRNRRQDAHEHELSAYVSKRVEGSVLDEARRILTRVAGRADLPPEELDSTLGAENLSVEALHSCGPSDPEQLADREGRWRCIERSMDHLRRDHRKLLWSYAEGRSISEIARRDGLPPSRLQNQMSRISREIRARSPELRRLLRHEI
ncbi:MAG: sigma-70 family RNA polymerase sigma factor [Deltaproteobacteria bacterium]|nr:sigma-70 family RNA polymerase sigma factor [Deltaproteobacteria bacterium]